MKKTFSFAALLLLLGFSACEKDETIAELSKEAKAASLTSPAAGFTKVITEADTLQKLTFKWKKADYGVSTAVTYVLQMDVAGQQFAKAISLGTTSSDSLTFDLGTLNNKLINDLKLPPNQAASLELRVSTVLGNKEPILSPVATITLTPFKKIPVVTKLWVPGAYQGWSPATAPVIYSVSPNVYEGYVYMPVGDYYKFTSAPDWNHINYGYAGAEDLSTDGNAEGLKVTAPGYYKFNVNVTTLKYSAQLVTTWGLIGTATPGSWDNSTPMTYDETKGVWTKTADLAAGALKFLANNGWDLNYGPASSNALTGQLVQTNDAINISEAGNYTVTLDFSRSQEPHIYTYTVKKN